MNYEGDSERVWVHLIGPTAHLPEGQRKQAAQATEAAFLLGRHDMQRQTHRWPKGGEMPRPLFEDLAALRERVAVLESVVIPTLPPPEEDAAKQMRELLETVRKGFEVA